MNSAPVVKDLVLIGGGHSHLAVLKRFGMQPFPGVRLTLISRELHTPYSGMLPGLVAGHYTFDEAHIDLGPLARFAGARLYHDDVVGIDRERREIHCRARPPVAYDCLSLDIGSAPDTGAPGSAAFAIPVKPVSNFYDRWCAARDAILSGSGPRRIGVVGGGAGGIEILLAIRHALLSALRADGRAADALSFHLITASDALLPAANARARRYFTRLCAARGIDVSLNARVREVTPDGVIIDGRGLVPLDETFWVTNASAQAWLATTGLALDTNGFVRVHDTLQTVTDPAIFACGDTAAVDAHPRPKSGVFAVRQGPPLADNLRRYLGNRPLKPFTPQRDFLSLVSTGDRHAVGMRGRIAFAGDRVWRVKDWIDRRFVHKYSHLPRMDTAHAKVTGHDPVALAVQALQADPMRCGGCGSKVGAEVLHDALRGIDVAPRADILVGLDQADDAAVVVPPNGAVLVHTVDSFRAFIDDPYRFAQIAAHHCLSDIFAMGATPQSALAIVTLPLATPRKMARDLETLMRGANAVFVAQGAAIVGGHTNEGPELVLGFAVNGYIAREALQLKRGAEPGDLLILTKPLGSGVLLAGDMRGAVKSRTLEAALASMLQSNGPAAAILRAHGAHALTDVTGFGLFGHLAEMLREQTLTAAIELDRLPLFDGAEALAADGVRSTLHAANAQLESAIAAADAVRQTPRYALGFDPQTSGGLLAAVPPAAAESILRALRDAGTVAVTIGTVGTGDQDHRIAVV